MPVHGFFPVKHGNPNARVISGSFAPAGTGSPTGAKGRGYTVERTAVGKYTLTFRQKYSHMLSALADVRFATPAGYKVVPGAYDAAARTLKLEVLKLDTIYHNLSLFGLREAISNDIGVAATAAARGSGSILASDTTPILERVSTSTDKAARVRWVAGNADEVQFEPWFPPSDIDLDSVVNVILRLGKDANANTVTVDVQAFSGVGDTEMGAATATIAQAVANYTVSLAVADISSGAPITIALVPSAHAGDALFLYGAKIEATRKLLADIDANENNRINFECVFQANSGPVT